MDLTNTPILETDLVLIHLEDKPAFYGRVELISEDVKPGWWRVKFVFLTIPYQVTTWILDNEQIRGSNFTMGGTPIRVEKLAIPLEDPTDESEQVSPPAKPKKGKARVVSLAKRKK